MNVAAAEYLIGLEKYIVIDGEMQTSLSQIISGSTRIRWQLVSPTDTEQQFLIDIKESPKKALAISLHHQDDISKEGIIRIDYHTRHRNPVTVLETVPDNFRPYAGIFLDEYPAHIHYMVDGYGPLEWAIPLEIDPFPVKDLNDIGDISTVIKAFCEKINVKTELKLSSQLRIL